MSFVLPQYNAPDFSHPSFSEAGTVVFREVEQKGVAPDNYHATSIFPEYYHVRKGIWKLPKESRMDAVVVAGPDDALSVKVFRNLEPGDRVACGRSENGEEGIYVHTRPFVFPAHVPEKFAFRTHLSRETSFSIDYDELYDLLDYERENGFIVWVLGPAVSFDHDAREAFVGLIRAGYVQALLAGNALATHDVEGALFGTALGQEIYEKKTVPLGHYKHLDAINAVRAAGSMESSIKRGLVANGIMRAAIEKGIPAVLAGSIRDDGPLPEVVGDVYRAQDLMREQTRKATAVIALATQLHAIATGNMVPSYKVLDDGTVRPVYFYSVDMSEFAVGKLANRGSLTARSILTNVQDFIVILERGLKKRARSA